MESILDQTEEMRNRIVEANFKWRQAQMMVDYAHKQLDFAVAKWKDINEIDARYVNFVIISKLHFFHLNDISHTLSLPNDYIQQKAPQTLSFIYSSQLEDRYAVAAETRNNLVAASQNIQGAQRYLSNIQFPYCAPPEVDTLNKVCSKK